MRHRQGTLGNREAAQIAEAILAREIAAAEGARGQELVQQVRPCAREIDSALAERMKRRDRVGAQAALLRFDEGLLSPGAASTYEHDPDPAFRALAPRALVDDDDAPARRAAFLLPEPGARRMAVLAARDGGIFADLEPLFEVARLDPEPSVQALAVRAVVEVVRREKSDVLRGQADEKRSALSLARAEKLGAARLAVDRLRDAWTSAPEGLREDIASAWIVTPLYEIGGREALRVRLAEGGEPRLALASAVLRRSSSRGACGEGPEPEDTFLRANADRVVLAALSEGTLAERQRAVGLVEPTAEGLEALRRAGKDEDPDLRVSALGRLAELPAERDAAIAALVRMAGQRPDRARGAPARAALASAKYLPVQAWIEEDLLALQPDVRVNAVRSLASLGRAARGAPLLADPDADVRVRAACALLRGTRG